MSNLLPKSRGWQVRDEVIQGAIRDTFGNDEGRQTVVLSREDVSRLAGRCVVRMGSIVDQNKATAPPVMKDNHV